MIRRNLTATLALTIVFTVGIGYAQNLSVQGTFLASTGSNNEISKFDIATGTQTILVRKSQISTDWFRLDCPAFSPDGRQIAFAMKEHTPGAIYIADNNGANIVKVCDRGGGDNVNWCTNGYIYWSENTNAIYRVNVLTKQKETIWDQPNVVGYSSTAVEDMTVSSDGQFGAARGSGKVSFFSIAAKTIYNYGNGGCSGWISRGGTRIIHPYTCCVSFPTGATSYNHVMAVESTSVSPGGGATLSPRPVITFLWAPGQPGGAEDARVGGARFAQNSDDYLLAHGAGSASQHGVIIYRVSSGAWKSLPKASTTAESRALWIGALPDPVSGGPRIAVSDPTVLLSSTTLRDTVSITNSATGTLSAVTITETAAWLTTSLYGTGNSQSLVLIASAAGLSAGTYAANVAISGGGASNSATVAVTFNVNVQLTAPSGLAATAGTQGNVTLAWTDNSANENGFAIERSSNGTTFSELKRTTANVTSIIDTNPGVGTWHYRVRAFGATQYSSYSNTAQVTVAAVSGLTLTAPLGGETVTAGSVLRVRWTAQNVVAVIIEASLDGGENWTRITTGAAVFSTDNTWGDYPWTTPSGAAQAKIRISDYNGGSASDESGAITISPSSRADISLARFSGVPGSVADIRRIGGNLLVSVNAHPEQALCISAIAIDGRVMARSVVNAGAGLRNVSFAQGGAGAVIIRVETPSGVAGHVIQAVR